MRAHLEDAITIVRILGFDKCIVTHSMLCRKTTKPVMKLTSSVVVPTTQTTRLFNTMAVVPLTYEHHLCLLILELTVLFKIINFFVSGE